MKLILRYLQKYSWMILADFICMAAIGLINLSLPCLTAFMIDNGVQTGNADLIWSLFWLMIAGCAVLLGLQVLGYWVSSKIMTGVVYDLRKDLFDHALSLSHQEIRKLGISSLITRTSSDSYQVMNFLNLMLRMTVFISALFLSSVVLALYTNVPLGLIVLVSIPLIVGGTVLMAKLSEPLSVRRQKSQDRINGILRNSLKGLRVIRAFCTEKTEEQRFKKENDEFRSASSSLMKLTKMTEPAFILLQGILTAALYFAGSLMIQNGSIQIGQLIAFLEYLSYLMVSVLLFCEVFAEFPAARVCARRMDEVLQTTTSIDPEGNGKILEPVQSLEFDHVDFKYPDGESLVLKDISFHALAGQKIAVVGSTGSGKSSLGKLIPRFYDVSSGTIKINGCSLQEYAPASLRDQVGYISQKPHLFSGTIQENIDFLHAGAHPLETMLAAFTAQAFPFIHEREKGFEGCVSEQGANLSGGQKQRLSIARALMKNPGLYIFDDSFSALDFATDSRLRRALAPALKKSIFLVAAQRISTILDADQIIVLDKGEMAGIGTHSQLFQTCSEYREIVLSQMSEQEALNYA
ncbi:MAG: ABC transporter ATP-binding protein [Erysipelotrichaceae bacterium]|nr:ABC transporter ATP-binding protein [Erysipelotrichaceae bacterium]